jgi:diguanylate cyclase (GGDEF)-like protein
MFGGVLIVALAVWSGGVAAQGPAMQWVTQAEDLVRDNPDSAMKLVKKALPALAGAADRSLKVKAEVTRCWAGLEVGTDSAAAYAAMAVADATAIGDDGLVARARVCRAMVRERAGQLDAAMLDYDFGVSEGTRLRNDSIRAEALVYRGELRYSRGEFNTAIVDMNMAYRLFTALHNDNRQRYALNAIANLYADKRVAEYEKALEYYRQLLEANRKINSVTEMAVAYFNLGSTLEQQGKYREALVEYQHGLALDQQRNDPDEVAEDQRAIGAVLYKLNRPKEALEIVQRAVARAESTGDSAALGRMRLTRGIALRLLGRTAEALADLDFSKSRNLDNNRYLEKIEAERALALAALGRWREAYEASHAQSELQRTLSESSQEQQSARLRAQFDTEKKEAENRILQQENEVRGAALAASARIRRLQVAVLALSAIVIAALLVLATRQIRHARRLRIAAMTDELTQLPNRRSLMQAANEQFKHARADGTKLGVLAVDIDHFKRINDSYGHPAGDAVLVRIAAAMQTVLRAGDHVGRTGGEEFVAVLPRTTEVAVADVANRIREAIEATDFSDVHPELLVTASIGTAVSNPADTTFSAIIKRADDSLYIAKEGGRNRVVSTPFAAGME